jgi:glycosyltransferase involved in cell wall biosynthesis
MRILVICQYYYPENVVITPICESLVARGHDVTVITGQPNYGFGRILPGYGEERDESIHGVHVHRLPLVARQKSRLSLIRNYLSFWHNSKHYLAHYEGDFDLVYSMSMSPLISVEGGAIFAKKHAIPDLIHCLDLWPESAVIAGKVRKNSLEYRFLYHWSKKIYSAADEILISSPSFRDYFKDVLHLENKPLVVVPQPPLISPLPREGIVYEKPYNIVYAGNLGNLQLVENYVEACHLLQGKYSFQFHILGSGAREEQVKNLINKYALQDTVVYHGIVPSNEVAKYFVNASALVVPLANTPSPVSKTIPNKLISSLYYGKPILASIGGDGEAILKDAHGTIFAGEKPEEISRAFVDFFSLDDAKRREMGTNNAAYFAAHYEFEKVMDQLETQFKEIKKS